MTTGYNIREGSAELARRRKVTEHDREVAAAMLRRLTIPQLWSVALVLLTDEARNPSRASFHPESLRA